MAKNLGFKKVGVSFRNLWTSRSRHGPAPTCGAGRSHTSQPDSSSLSSPDDLAVCWLFGDVLLLVGRLSDAIFETEFNLIDIFTLHISQAMLLVVKEDQYHIISC